MENLNPTAEAPQQEVAAVESIETPQETAAEQRTYESTADIIIKVIKIGMILYLTILAILRQSQRKKPTLAIPSTIIIIPAMNIIVSQFIPVLADSEEPAAYQK